VGEGHGPPTHFITLSCAEFWWPDLRWIVAAMERLGGNIEQAQKTENNDLSAISKSVRRYPLFFIIHASVLIETTLKTMIDLEYYWGQVKLAPGRGQIHLHLLAIMKDKGYLHQF
jgi:hypothetical protein